jgi:hypothetical protein
MENTRYTHRIVSVLAKRPRRKWEDNIKTHVREIGCGFRAWMELVLNPALWWAFVLAILNLLL